MQLLELPAELVLHILTYVGPGFFHQNLDYLTISRQWYSFAWHVFVRDLQLTSRSLMRLTEDVAAFMPPSSQPRIATVELSLEGFKEPNPLTQIDRRGTYGVDVDDVDEWTAHLNYSLACLAAMLQQCPALRGLKLNAGSEYELGYLWRHGYLMLKPLADLLSVCHLTSLEFDIGYYALGQTDDSHVHLCCYINSLLKSLRRLHCRMTNICERLLEPPEDDTPLKLEEVIINLCLSEPSESIMFYRVPRHCQSIPGESFWRLKDAIENQAATLACHLSNPRMVRVVWHKLPAPRIFAFDAMTGQRLRLGETNTEWDADGEVVDDDLWEDELDLLGII
ncbi:hypothetical protein F5Y12DRAFT_761369 [Xylaria sp. FL1777]|nr:hypothetical protein F5Y12DRAFT_761369 [Xylaria sp. FL1777]